MPIFNMVGGGGASGVEIVKKETVTVNSKYFEMPISINDYQARDFLYIRRKESSTDTRIITEMYLAIAESTMSGSTHCYKSSGVMKFGNVSNYEPTMGYTRTLGGYFTSIFETNSGTNIYASYSSFYFYGDYDVLLLRVSS